MDIGVVIFPTDQSIQPIELAKELEARGFESVWFPEHSHIPTSRETPWGGMKDAPPLPEMYWRSHDQFVALTACAAVTEKLRVGTGITLVAQRDAIWLAKEAASLDMSPSRSAAQLAPRRTTPLPEHHALIAQPRGGASTPLSHQNTQARAKSQVGQREGF